jgi:MFS transporter, DHA2 family, multidrug resistance protein
MRVPAWLAMLAPRPPDPPKPGEKAAKPEPLTGRLMLGIGGALIAGFLSYMDTRIGQEALPDLRGGFGYGMDSGSWISTAFNVGELAVVPITPWLASIFSVRRMLAVMLALSVLAGAACPDAPNFPSVMACRFLQGMGDGALIPLLLMAVLRNLTGHRRVWGVALYGMIVNLPPTISDLVAGWYPNVFTWKGLFWENVLPGGVAMVLVLVGLPVERTHLSVFRRTDYFGMFCLIVALGMLATAMGQGQRLDWFDSGLVSGLFFGFAILFAAFVANELLAKRPLIELGLLARRNLWTGLSLMLVFNFAQLSTVFVLPQFGSEIRGFRPEQVGQILIGFAVVELVLPFAVAWLLRRIDVRIMLALGLLTSLVGNRLATFLSADWAETQFALSQALQAASWPVMMVSIALTTTSTMRPKDTISGSALFNSTRTLATTVGSAVVGAIVTVRERVHSFHIAEHVVTGAPITGERLAAGGLQAVAGAVRAQSYVMAYADALGWITLILLAGFVLVVVQQETRVPRPP